MIGRRPIDLWAADTADAELLARLTVTVQSLHRDARPDVFRDPDHAALSAFFAAELADANCTAVVAELDGRPAGFALLYLRERTGAFAVEARSLHIDQISVEPWPGVTASAALWSRRRVGTLANVAAAGSRPACGSSTTRVSRSSPPKASAATCSAWRRLRDAASLCQSRSAPRRRNTITQPTMTRTPMKSAAK